MANKVAKVTRDYPNANHRKSSDGARLKRASADMAEGRYAKLRPVESRSESGSWGHKTKMTPHYKASDVYKMAGDKDMAKETKEGEERASKRYIGYNPHQVSAYSKKEILKKYKG